MSTRILHFFLFLLAVVLVLPAAADAWELRLTNDTYDQSHPSISGTRVVWQDNRNGNWDIYLNDAATGLTSRLTSNAKDQVNPQIAGHYVVWEDYRNSAQKENPDIYLLDLNTGTESMVNDPLSAVFGGYECQPAIDDSGGSVVVTWVETAEGISEQARVFYRYIDTPMRYRAYEDSNIQSSPDVSDRRLAWTDRFLGGVYFRHIETRLTEPVILERASNDTIKGVRISGDWIVWSQYVPSRWAYNIRAFRLNPDLTSGSGSWLSPQDAWQEDPAIDGNLVVWSDERNGVSNLADLFVYDLSSKTERAIEARPGDQRQAAIDGELVVFTDTRNGNNEIYMAPARDSTPMPGLAVAPVPPGSAPPRDLSGDGTFEDVNGNGRADFADVVLYFNQMTWIAANEPVTAFDYNRNNRIDFADVVALFNTL